MQHAYFQLVPECTLRIGENHHLGKTVVKNGLALFRQVFIILPNLFLFTFSTFFNVTTFPKRITSDSENDCVVM